MITMKMTEQRSTYTVEIKVEHATKQDAVLENIHGDKLVWFVPDQIVLTYRNPETDTFVGHIHVRGGRVRADNTISTSRRAHALWVVPGSREESMAPGWLLDLFWAHAPVTLVRTMDQKVAG